MNNYRPAILSASLGRAWLHELQEKLEQAAKYGFQGIEIFYEDLEFEAKRRFGVEDPSDEQLLEEAGHIRACCVRLGLEVISMQPFLFYEGLLDRTQHERLIEKMKLWFKLVKALGTSTIQIPANFLPKAQLTDDPDVIASDLRQLADMGLREEPTVRFAYENLCWSTCIDTWEKAWDIVKRVDRENFGICLDTFNIAGRVWADPTSPNGMNSKADEALRKSLDSMVLSVDVNKVFYVQVVDAERLASPLVEGHEFHVEDQPPRMSWSRNARAFAFEKERGAYLPVDVIAKTIIQDMGYEGFISMELFSRTMSEPGKSVPEDHARRGGISWKRCENNLKLNSFA